MSVNKYAWVIHPYPNGTYRMKEFLDKNIVAIGWQGIGDLSKVKTRDEIKNAIQSHYQYESPRSLGQPLGSVSRFVLEMNIGDYVLARDTRMVYVGEVISDYQFDPSVDTDSIGYSHQRRVKWLYGKKAIPRDMLKGRLFDALKGRGTVFTTLHEDVEEIVNNEDCFYEKSTDEDLKAEYLKRLQTGSIRKVNSNTFENIVCKLLSKYFPGLVRLGTNNSKQGDTDLLARLPGNVNVRIQVKHFYPEQGAIEPWVVDQLADSMEIGDCGIIVTSGTVGDEAKVKANSSKDKSISFIDGQEFVDILFENKDELTKEDLVEFGLISTLDFL